jgi:hypothetical protein
LYKIVINPKDKTYTAILNGRPETHKIYDKKFALGRFIDLEFGTKYAKGGMTEHGLKVGDEIMGYTKDVNEVHVVNRKNNDEWHSVDLDDGKRYAGGGGVDYPNHYLEVEDLNRKINALTQQIEADYRNDEIDAYTDRNERELEKLKQKREFLMYGKDSYSQGGSVKDELYVAEYGGSWTIKDKLNPKGNYTLSSKKERAEENMQFLIDNPSRLAYYRKNEYAEGGGISGLNDLIRG